MVHEAGQLPQSNAEVKNDWSFMSTSPYFLMARYWTQGQLS